MTFDKIVDFVDRHMAKFVLVAILLLVFGGMTTCTMSARSAARGDGHTPNIHTHLVCKTISTDRVVIDRDEPTGTWFRNTSGYVIINSKTPEGKRRWTLLANDLICEETEV